MRTLYRILTDLHACGKDKPFTAVVEPGGITIEAFATRCTRFYHGINPEAIAWTVEAEFEGMSGDGPFTYQLTGVCVRKRGGSELMLIATDLLPGMKAEAENKILVFEAMQALSGALVAA